MVARFTRPNARCLLLYPVRAIRFSGTLASNGAMPGPTRAPFLLPACVVTLALASVPFCPTVIAQDFSGSHLQAAALPASAAPLSETESSSTPPESAPEALAAEPSFYLGTSSATVRRGNSPFSALAVAVKIGTGGIGFDVATPLAQRFNLRGGASFFQYTGSYDVDGTTINGQAKLRSVGMSVDWFPFNNRFHISPGVNFYNGSSLNASAMVPGGQTFTLEDATYTSSPTDPVHGSASMTFGNKTAPSLTVGVGNMIPRHGSGHFSVPVELGFEYISRPLFHLDLQGTACSQGICQSTSLPEFQQNLRAEEAEINSDIAPLRFFPIFSVGLAYKF